MKPITANTTSRMIAMIRGITAPKVDFGLDIMLGPERNQALDDNLPFNVLKAGILGGAGKERKKQCEVTGACEKSSRLCKRRIMKP